MRFRLASLITLSLFVAACASAPDVFRTQLRALLRAIAYGSELNLVHPPRPADPKVAWEPEWAVKVRVKSVASAMAGMPSMEAMRPADTREAKDSEPAEKKEEAKKPSAFDILRGVIGR